MSLERTILNLETYREEKQILAEQNARQLYRKALEDGERNANIREKVRAKHLFRKLLGLPPNQPLSKELETAFIQWFIFDYQTIQGLTIFHLFLKKASSFLSEPEMIQGAMFLTATVEPYEITGKDEAKNELAVRNLYDGKAHFVSPESEGPLPLECGQYVFLRKLPLIKRDLILGPIFLVQQAKAIEEMKRAYESALNSGRTISWREFLKRQAFRYVYKSLGIE